MLFSVVCALVALFCAVALGLGPALFTLAGAAGAWQGFRFRRSTWWGLPLSAASLAVAAGCLAQWRVRTDAALAVVLFVVLAAARSAGHARARNGEAR